MPIAAAAIGAGSSLIGGYFARKDEKQARKLAESEKANALKFLEEAGSRDAFFQALQEAQLKSGQAKALGGFAGARKATELGADAARRTVLDQGARMQADATQGLISQGLIGTSSGQGVASDLTGQTTQQLAAIDQQLASAFADLNLAEGGLQQDQARELADLLGSGRQFQQQIGMARTDFAPASAHRHKSSNFFGKALGATLGGSLLGF